MGRQEQSQKPHHRSVRSGVRVQAQPLALTLPQTSPMGRKSTTVPLVAATCTEGIERLRVLPATDRVSSQQGPWPRYWLSAQKHSGLPLRR